MSSTETLVFRSAGTSPVRPPFNDPQARRESRLFQYRLELFVLIARTVNSLHLGFGSEEAEPLVALLSRAGLDSFLSLFCCHHFCNSIKAAHSRAWPGRTRRPVIDRWRYCSAKEREDKGRHEYLSRLQKRIL